MTYYELVKFLHSLISSPIEYKNIEFLNSVNINLEDERYQRFLDQMVIVISDRITNAINNFKDKLVSETLDVNTLTIEISILKKDIKYCEDLCSCLLVKPENKEEFLETINTTNNSLADTLMKFFDDDERKMIIQSMYHKEDII